MRKVGVDGAVGELGVFDAKGEPGLLVMKDGDDGADEEGVVGIRILAGMGDAVFSSIRTINQSAVKSNNQHTHATQKKE